MERKWWTLLAVCTGTFMLLLDVTIVVVAIPNIQRGLHASFGQVQWVVDAYALTLASLLLTAGVLADRYGRRLLFAIGLVIFTLGSLLCGLAQNPLMPSCREAARGSAEPSCLPLHWPCSVRASRAGTVVSPSERGAR